MVIPFSFPLTSSVFSTSKFGSSVTLSEQLRYAVYC